MKRIIEWLRALWFRWTVGPGTIREHRASFLLDDARVITMNMTSHTVTDSACKAVVKRCRDKGDTVWYALAVNADPRMPHVTPYAGAFGGAVSEARIATMVERLHYVREKGMCVVLWLMTDDSGRYVPYNDTKTIKEFFGLMVNRLDHCVAEYVLGVEVNEYWSLSQCAELARYLRTLTDKPIGLHMTTGQYEWSRAIGEVTRHYHQYGWLATPGQISTATKTICAKVGKPVVASEYDKSSNRGLGAHAVAAGAIGYGNG